KLRIRKPCVLAGPQPKHELFGAYSSWSDRSFICSGAMSAEITKPAVIDRRNRLKFKRRLLIRQRKSAALLRCKVIAAGSSGYCLVARLHARTSQPRARPRRSAYSAPDRIPTLLTLAQRKDRHSRTKDRKSVV